MTSPPPIRMDRMSEQQWLEAASQRNTESEGRIAVLWRQKIIILALFAAFVAVFVAGILIGEMDFGLSGKIREILSYSHLPDAHMQGMEVGGAGSPWYYYGEYAVGFALEIGALLLAIFTAYIIWMDAELPKEWKKFCAFSFFGLYVVILLLVGMEPLFLLIAPPFTLIASLCRLAYAYILDANQSAAAYNQSMTTKVLSAFKTLFKKKLIVLLLISYALVFYAFLFPPLKIWESGRILFGTSASRGAPKRDREPEPGAAVRGGAAARGRAAAGHGAAARGQPAAGSGAARKLIFWKCRNDELNDFGLLNLDKEYQHYSHGQKVKESLPADSSSVVLSVDIVGFVIKSAEDIKANLKTEDYGQNGGGEFEFTCDRLPWCLLSSKDGQWFSLPEDIQNTLTGKYWNVQSQDTVPIPNKDGHNVLFDFKKREMGKNKKREISRLKDGVWQSKNDQGKMTTIHPDPFNKAIEQQYQSLCRATIGQIEIDMCSVRLFHHTSNKWSKIGPHVQCNRGLNWQNL